MTTKQNTSTATVGAVKTGRGHHTPASEAEKSEPKYGADHCKEHHCTIPSHGHVKKRTGFKGAMQRVREASAKKTAPRAPEIVACSSALSASECPQKDEPHYHTLGAYIDWLEVAEDQNLRNQDLDECYDDLCQLPDPSEEVSSDLGEHVEATHHMRTNQSGPIESKYDQLCVTPPHFFPIREPAKAENKASLDGRVATQATSGSELVADSHKEKEEQVAVYKPTLRVNARAFEPSAREHRLMPVDSTPIVDAPPPVGQKTIEMAPTAPPLYRYADCTMQTLNEFVGEPVPYEEESLVVEARIIYNTTTSTSDNYADTMFNHLIMWLCGTSKDVKRNQEYDLFLPEFTQFMSTDQLAIGKFWGFNLKNWLSSKPGKESLWWQTSPTINGRAYAPGLFDAIKLLGYTSYSKDFIIKPLFDYLDSLPEPQLRQVIGTDGKLRSHTRAAILTLSQKCPQFARYKKHNRYYENTIDYFVTLMAVRDIHRFYRAPNCDISTKPVFRDTPALNIALSKGERRA